MKHWYFGSLILTTLYCIHYLNFACSITVRLVWDSCGVGSKAYLDKLNRSAACIIEGRGIGAEELKSTLGWSNLKARRNYLKCVLVHKCLHGIASSYLLSEFRHVLLFRAYNTRSCDLLHPPFAKTTRYQGSFRINGAWTYNSLPKTNR